MSPLPLPVRIAAGLAATAVEQARELPRLVVEFPVTAVSQALQASMRVQQKVTELAIKGDKALGSFSQAPESPAWATFDDDLDPAPAARFDTEPVSEPVKEPVKEPEPITESEPAAKSGTDSASDTASDSESDAEPVVNGHAAVTPITPTTPVEGIAEVAEKTLGAEADTPPAVLPGYPDMNLHQLRGHLRKLDIAGLQALLIWETSHENRPPFVTMLSNRITTVQENS